MGWISYGPLSTDKELTEIGYAIDPEYWGNGYATMAGKAFLKWLALHFPGLDIYAEVDKPVRNSRSKRDHSRAISRTELTPPIQMAEMVRQK